MWIWKEIGVIELFGFNVKRTPFLKSHKHQYSNSFVISSNNMIKCAPFNKNAAAKKVQK